MARLLDLMRQNPAGDWTISDIDRLCRHHGLRCTPPTGGGSHYKVSHPSMREILIVPYRRPVKAYYIRALVRFIDGLEHRP